jgi:hypothetical protein
MSTTLIEQLDAIVATGEVSRAGLARAAGLHPNSLRKLGQADWNPTADTLVRLEKLIQRGSPEVLVGPETIINEARNGRMFVLVDDDDRENEGDLVIPAQMATPDAINFMVRHGRGLVCLALTKERADQLGLEPMTRTNRSRMETAFTVSIEAREGITTGISAADRARTMAVAIDASNGCAGIAEVIKHAAIRDADFFAWLETNMAALLARDRPALMHAIHRSCAIKAGIVGVDEREAGERALLNFGHTFGHAIEAAQGYGAWLHGEAVAAGMVCAAKLSERVCGLKHSETARLTELIAAAKLPTAPPKIPVERWLELMRRDKKVEGGAIRFVLLERLGRAVMRSGVADSALMTSVSV